MLVKSPAPKRKKPNTQSQSSVKTPQTVERNSQLKSDPQVYVEIPFVDQSDPLGISNVEENIPTAADEEDSGGENDYEAGADIPEKVKVAIENLNHLENFFTPSKITQVLRSKIHSRSFFIHFLTQICILSKNLTSELESTENFS